MVMACKVSQLHSRNLIFNPTPTKPKSRIPGKVFSEPRKAPRESTLPPKKASPSPSRRSRVFIAQREGETFGAGQRFPRGQYTAEHMHARVYIRLFSKVGQFRSRPLPRAIAKVAPERVVAPQGAPYRSPAATSRIRSYRSIVALIFIVVGVTRRKRQT